MRWLLAMVLGASTAVAAPLEMTHNVRMLDGLGDPLEGDNTVVVTLYRDDGGAQSLWTRTYATSFERGYTSMVLADGSPALTTELLSGGDVYVGLRVVPDVEDMLPRQKLLQVPFAGVASAVPTSGSPGTSCTAAGQVIYDTSTSSLLACDGSVWGSVGASAPRVAWVKEVRTSGDPTLAHNGVTIRALNTIVGDTSMVSIPAGNNFVLGPGTYELMGWSAAQNSNANVGGEAYIALADTGAALEETRGLNRSVNINLSGQDPSVSFHFGGVVTLTETTALQLRQYTGSNGGSVYATNDHLSQPSTNEVHSAVRIMKLD